MKFSLLGSLAMSFCAAAFGQQLTVQVGSPPPPPAPLVNHLDTWQWHKGTNAPQLSWQTISDASLNTDWGSGQGGFGYSSDTANETNQCRTILSDMRGTTATNYSTFYIRKTFTINNGVDTNAHIVLTMDWDDGFIAWLDGVYITNRNVTGAPAEPLFTATASQNHESSGGTSGGPVETYDLGAVGTRTGTHVLAIMGLNGNKSTSTDFILVSDLALSFSTGGAVANNGIYALTSSNSVVLTGSNTVVGSTRLTVNGDDAAFNSTTGTWSKVQILQPGLNRLFIAALDNSGNLLSNLTQDVVYEPATVTASGALAANTFWTNTAEVVHVTSTVTVPANLTLTIGPGVVVIVSPGASLLANAGGSIDVQGAETREVYFLPGVSNVWNEIAADGANSFLTIRHADINRGAVKFRNGATGLLEDSYVHEFKNGTIPIAGCTSAAAVTVRRSHFSIYHETLWQITPMLVEDSLFENANNASSDALDFDTAPAGSVIRRCTFRFGPQSNTDAIDIGSGSTATLIENCLMHDFPFDKGVSIGETSYAITIRNCLMYGNDSGIAVKDSCTAIVEGCTIANCDFGFKNFNKANPASPTGGGHITNSSNNILWNNITNVSLLNSSTLVADYSDIQGTNWPGTGNIDADPLFVNAAARDYRLQPGSPCLGTGAGGTNMGVTLPVGGIPMWVFKLAAASSGTNPVTLSWQENADNETGFRIERSTDQTAWQTIGGAPANALNFVDTTGVLGQKYYYRVRATNDSGMSPLSNIASGTRQAPTANVGGTISSDTTWANGTHYIVTSSVTIASGATLTIEPGVTVCFNTGLGMTVANGGRLLAEGTSNAPILFTRSPANATTWTGLTISGSVGSPETRIAYARFEFTSADPCLQVSAGTVFFDHLTFGNTADSYIHLDGASFIIQNCVFPSATGSFELVHGTGGIKSGGRGIFTRNFFGIPRGYNDVVDFTGGNRPGPIVQFIDNVFLGATDDILDLDGTDAWVEHNIFLHCHKNGSPDTASCVSGEGGTADSEITVVGNLAFDVDHFAMGKAGNFYALYNNTIVHQSHSGGTDTDGAVLCLADEGFSEAAGMYLEGNIIYDAEKFLRFHTNSIVTLSNNITPTNLVWSGPGGANSAVDPLLNYIPTLSQASNFTSWAEAQVMWDWFSLKTNSPAIATGPNGLDKGGVVPIGASVSGEPSGSTLQSNATLVVGINRTGSGIPTTAAAWPNGAGYTHYKWRLDTGAWSAETPIATPISLANLSQGLHYVDVTGKRDSGFYQDDAAYGPDAVVTRSHSWFVGELQIQSISLSGNTVHIQFTAYANTGYTIQYRDSLSSGSWQTLVHLDPSGSTQPVNFPDTLPPGTTTRFYRLSVP